MTTRPGKCNLIVIIKYGKLSCLQNRFVRSGYISDRYFHKPLSPGRPSQSGSPRSPRAGGGVTAAPPSRWVRPSPRPPTHTPTSSAPASTSSTWVSCSPAPGAGAWQGAGRPPAPRPASTRCCCRPSWPWPPTTTRCSP